MSKPIMKFIDLSTGYVKMEELTMMAELDEGSEIGVRVIPHEYGYWVNVPGEDSADNEEYLARLREKGYNSLADCVKYAFNNECLWINFDEDGGVLEGEDSCSLDFFD